MNGDLGALLRGLPPLLLSHIELSALALLLAVGISVPLGLAVANRPRLAYPLVTATAVVQTIPGLALLALMVPLLAATGGLGVGVSAFGFPPALIALTLYALLPVLRNTVVGLRGVDAAAVEAARGMGMSERQVLLRVQLPMAAPVVAAGIRTAAVWTVGAATLATPVGQRCLGNYIFAGLQTRHWQMVLVGVIAAAGLAILLDLGLGAVERAAAARRGRSALLTFAALVVALGLAAAALPVFEATRTLPRAGTQAAHARAGQAAKVARRSHVRVGAKTFTEQYILAEVLRTLLEAQGFTVEVAQSLGSTVVFDALRQGDLDVYVDYSGTIWTNQMQRREGGRRWRVLSEVEGWLAHQYGIRSLGSLGFENAYALAMRREHAERLGVRDIGGLAGLAPRLSMGGDYEFFGRDEWTGLRAAYDLRFAGTTSFDPTLMYEALAAGKVDVISAFSSDGRIAAYDLVVLDDPAGALPPYDAMVLLGPQVADDARLACALAPLHDAIPVALMRAANLMVDRAQDKQSPAQAAAWLLEQAHVRVPSCP